MRSALLPTDAGDPVPDVGERLTANLTTAAGLVRIDLGRCEDPRFCEACMVCLNADGKVSATDRFVAGLDWLHSKIKFAVYDSRSVAWELSAENPAGNPPADAASG
jgi:hypothetical protein